MSSSPGLEHSAPPTPSTPAYRGDLNQPTYQVAPQATSTPSSRDHSTHKIQKHHPALQVVLPPASGNYIGDVGTPPPPRSPAALSAGEPSPRHPIPDGTSSDKSSEAAGVGAGGVTGGSASRLSRAESYKQQRQRYRREKKRAATALLCSIDDPAACVLADWLKVRGSLKSWTKLWCMLKPGLLLLYKSNKAKSSHWVGTVLLNTCHVIERPSKKDGFCFKLYHPLEQSIWAPRGPSNETLGAVIQPFPTTHLIFRAPSQAAGHCWLDGLELALKCSTAMLRCSGSSGVSGQRYRASEVTAVTLTDATVNHETQWSRDDLEMHFRDHELEGVVTDSDESEASTAAGRPLTADMTLAASAVEERLAVIQRHVQEFYLEDLHDDVGKSGELVEEIAEENKSLLWFLIKQVRPGMDLSKVVLPTFILEPRSFLDKLSDNYYHADILSSAVLCDSPYERFKLVVRWYMSGLYRKPRGLKKPYNPVLGEVFRCHWLHPTTGTRTYYVSEQVSHHPPVSAFYVSNRKEGFIIEGSLLAKSKFYGNSTSAILEGAARVHLLPRGEVYTTSAPYAHCKGIVMGTLSMELGGKVSIVCDTTGYSADIDFKLKSFLGGSESTNLISGRIRKGKDTVAHLDGYWDGRIDIKDKRTGDEGVLLDVGVLKQQRLRRYTVRTDRQVPFESQRLWANVSRAINNEDQVAATEEKTVIEEAQRARAKSQGSSVWLATHFQRHTPVDAVLDGNGENHVWLYNHRNPEVWSESEVIEWEEDFHVKSLQTDAPRPAAAALERAASHDTDDSDAPPASPHAPPPRHARRHQGRNMKTSLLSIDSAIRDQTDAIKSLQKTVERLESVDRYRARRTSDAATLRVSHALYVLGLAVALQLLFYWAFY